MIYRSSCPACASNDVNCRFHKDKYEVWRCERCGSMFVHNIPAHGTLRDIYASDDYYSLPEDSLQRIKDESIRRLKRLTKYNFLSKSSLMDVGCAQGTMLDAAQRFGFETFGIEMSARNVNVARLKGHEVFHGALRQFCLENPDRKFDVVLCLDVIEHVPAPREFLTMVSTLLTNEGVAVISTPNYSGIIAQALKEKDPYMIPPEHVNFFTILGLKYIVQQSDLRVLRWETFGQLTQSELDRVSVKYFPYGDLFKPFVKCVTPQLIKMLNSLKMGLELEFYLGH